MSLRARVALLAAASVVVPVVLLSVAFLGTLRRELNGEVDRTLLSQAQRLSQNPGSRPGSRRDGTMLGALGMSVAVVRDGRAVQTPGTLVAVPVDMAEVRRVGADTNGRPRLRDAYSAGVHLRIVTIRAGDGAVLVVARSLTDVDRTFSALETLTIVFALLAVGVAATTGIGLASAGLRPVRRLTLAAARIARTHDLSTRPIEVVGDDEIARLAESFNAMLGALNRAREHQRRLVADAGHELRTPLTSLRTNIDLLVQWRRLPERTLPHGDIDSLLSDVRAQLKELSALVNDLVELSRDGEPDQSLAAVRFDEVVENSISRIRRRAPAAGFDVLLEPWLVYGSAPELERAVTNLLDNAVKFSPATATVRVTLCDGALVVEDQGPGIMDKDLPHVFERFYRSNAARTLPGSGLGLAIVRHAAERHRGRVAAENRPEGGARLRMVLPGEPIAT